MNSWQTCHSAKFCCNYFTDAKIIHSVSFLLQKTISMDKETMMNAVLKECRLIVDGIEEFDSPAVTTYVITPKPGVKLVSFQNKAIDVAFALGRSVRCSINGLNVEYEVAKDKTERRIVDLQEMLGTPEWETAKSEMKLPIPLGIDTHGVQRYADLTQMPHLLVGGATKQGKTEFIRCLISSLASCRSRDELQFHLLDNKAREFKEYESDHKVVYGKDCISELRLLNEEMDSRHNEIAYNPDVKFPYMVVVVDEYSNFLYEETFRDIQKDVIQIAQKGRKVGIHLIVTTQRVDRDVVSMLLKANISTSIAFRVATSHDSRLLLGIDGAEMLTGSGDMLFMSGAEQIRIQSPIDKK